MDGVRGGEGGSLGGRLGGIDGVCCADLGVRVEGAGRVYKM